MDLRFQGPSQVLTYPSTVSSVPVKRERVAHRGGTSDPYGRPVEKQAFSSFSARHDAGTTLHRANAVPVRLNNPERKETNRNPLNNNTLRFVCTYDPVPTPRVGSLPGRNHLARRGILLRTTTVRIITHLDSRGSSSRAGALGRWKGGPFRRANRNPLNNNTLRFLLDVQSRSDTQVTIAA